MTGKVLFVLGAHTDVGKTYAACAILQAARARGLAVDAFKPVVSGFDEADWAGSDPGQLLGALGRPLTVLALNDLSPWRFAAPLAPPAAARREGQALPLAPLVRACRERALRGSSGLLVIETAGGVLSPVADDGLSIDLASACEGAALLVGGTYLGAISHTLTALEAMRARGRPPAAVLVSETGGDEHPDYEESLAFVVRHAGSMPVLSARRHGDAAWTSTLLDLIADA